MLKSESIRENGTHKILGSLEIQTDNLIPEKKTKTQTNIDLQEKMNYHQVDIAVPADHRVKIKESEKIDKYLYIAKEF